MAIFRDDDFKARWVQALGKSGASRTQFYFHLPPSWQPSSVSNEHPALRPLDLANELPGNEFADQVPWVHTLGWVSYLAELGDASFDELKALVAVPSQWLASRESGAAKWLELGLLLDHDDTSLYMENAYKYVASMHGAVVASVVKDQ